MNLPENYILEKRKIKHARIRVSENLSVRVLIPEYFTDKDVQLLLKKKQKWIDKHLTHFKRKRGGIKLHRNQLLLFGNRYTYFFNEKLHHKVSLNQEHKTVQSKLNLLDKDTQLKWYRKFAKQYITERLTEFAKKNRFKFNKVFIRDQRTKWGNCSAEKNLSFNWRLIKAPYFVIDYLIIHELVHTRTMNHHQKFWTELKSLCPDYREAVRWLDEYGNSL